MAAEFILQRIVQPLVRSDRSFAIYTQQVLALRDESNLLWGACLLAHDESTRYTGGIVENMAQLSACGVIAHKTNNGTACSQRSDVPGDVGCAPCRRSRRSGQQHWNRAFRRNPLDASVDEAIEHDVANAEGSEPRQLRGEMFDVVDVLVVPFNQPSLPDGLSRVPLALVFARLQLS